MTDTGCVLAIDQGGQSTRAIAFDRRGRALNAHRAGLATDRPRAGWVEHDPAALLDSARAAVAGVTGLDDCGVAGLATQRSSIVCWNRDTGEALSPVISWQDRRAADILERLAPPDATVRRITGLVRSPHYGASKLRWCLDRLPAVQRAREAGTLAMGPLSSFLVFHLAENRPFVVDPANASRTLLWDVSTGDWSGSMLEAFGIPREALPRCVASRHAYGRLTGTGVSLEVVTGDQSAAIFAGGPLEAGVAYINIGTGAFVLAASNGAPPPATRLLRSVVWRDETAVKYVLEGTVNGAGSALAAQNSTAGDIGAAGEAIGAPGVPIFLNGVSGLGSPYWRDDFDSRFVGTGSDATRNTAVMESILFLLQVNLDEIARVTSLRASIVSGGLARHDGLCQGLADLTGMPALRPDEPEATARGVAFLTAGQPAAWEEGTRQRFLPVAGRTHLSSRYRVWREAMAAALAGED